MAFEDFFGEEGNRLFEYGLDRGVFYPKDGESGAQPWMGLTNLKITSDGAKTEPVVVNGFVQAYDVSPGTFKAVLDCFTAPSNFFKVADGIRFLENEAFSATDQGRDKFDLSWRTRIGDDIVGDNGDEYKIHLLYDAYASPSARNYSTITAETDLAKFSYDLVAVPQAVDGALPTAHFVIDTRPLHPYLVNKIEHILYTSVGSLPTLDFLMEMASEEPPVVLTNYATNPSFEAAGSGVVVRTNLSVRPRGVQSWLSYYSTDYQLVPNVTPPVPHPLGITTANRGWSTAANQTSRIVTIYNADGLGGDGPERGFGFWVLTMQEGYEASTDMSGMPWVPLTPGQWTFIVSPVLLNAGKRAWVYVRRADLSIPPTDHEVYLTGSISLEGQIPTAFFDGSYSPDPDLTARWTGTVNASTSELVGVQPFSTTHGTSAVTVLSQRWSDSGTHSVRIIPTSTSSGTYASPGGDIGAMRLGMQAGETYTVLGVCRLTSSQEGTLSDRARRLVFFSRPAGGSYTTILSDAAPNEPGEHHVRLTFTVPADATEAFIRAYNGASAGNGDVWWDSVAVVPGVYDGPYFDGYTDDGKWGYGEWDLNPDASISRYRSFGPKPKKA